jgi:hypothetical protein
MGGLSFFLIRLSYHLFVHLLCGFVLYDLSLPHLHRISTVRIVDLIDRLRWCCGSVMPRQHIRTRQVTLKTFERSTIGGRR